MSDVEADHPEVANVFVLGLDPRNLETLRDVRGMRDYRFHQLLSHEELTTESRRLPDLLGKAQRQLDAFGGRVDAIVGYWDFPVSSMAPILCRQRGLRSASLEAVVKCEHKYWSRLEQQQVIDEHPRFGLVELDDDAPPEHVGYPMWLKPVKSTSSELAFQVHDQREFTDALATIRDGIGRLGDPFQFVLDHLDLPPEIAEVGAHACLAEESVSGAQVTVEGYRTDTGVCVYGVVDSHHYPDRPSFLRYQYPSAVPAPVQDRMSEVARRVITRIGLESVAFNIEFFWDPDTDAINLLEVNPRHSQSHAMLFDYVDGVPNHQCMVRLALGLDPDLPRRQGRYDVAAKWFMRRFDDAVVVRVPTDEEIAGVERRIDGCAVDIGVREGDRLSELTSQDSYSYAVAQIHIGARGEDELTAKYERCLAALERGFEFADPDKPADSDKPADPDRPADPEGET